MTKLDDLVKSRHSRVGGTRNAMKRLDSRFHGNDGNASLRTFCEAIKLGPVVKGRKIITQRIKPYFIRITEGGFASKEGVRPNGNWGLPLLLLFKDKRI